MPTTYRAVVWSHRRRPRDLVPVRHLSGCSAVLISGGKRCCDVSPMSGSLGARGRARRARSQQRKNARIGLLSPPGAIPVVRDVFGSIRLKGAKPADLPAEQPTILTCAINPTRAKTLGISTPPTLFAAANEVIDQVCLTSVVGT